MTPRIISASRRTDLPAFHTPWFMEQVRAGFCQYPNPRFPGTMHQVSLRQEDVLGFVFWTRHAAPLLDFLPALERAGHACYFHYTITGYPRSIEPGAPPTQTALQTFAELARRIGPERVIWRYDPVVLDRELTTRWHEDNFARLLDALATHTRRIVLSVIDPYPQARRFFAETREGVIFEPPAYENLLAWMANQAAARGLLVQSCAEPALHVPGILPGRCIDPGLLPLHRTGRLRPHKQRPGCNCVQSTDIGTRNTCAFGCRYCYATSSPPNTPSGAAGADHVNYAHRLLN